MRKQLVLAGVLLLSVVAFGQKKEIKKAQKALAAENVTEALAFLGQAEVLIAGADNTLKAQFYIIKAETLLKGAGDDLTKLQAVGALLDMAFQITESSKFQERLDVALANTKADLINSAIKDQNAKNYISASDKLYAGYLMSKADTSYLYYAAGNAVNGKNYDKAMLYYKELVDMGYTGKREEIIATNKETSEVESFSSIVERDLMVKSEAYIKPDVRTTKSQSGEILRNLTLIYIEKGDNESAMVVMKNARASNPNDIVLARAEADMVYRMGDLERYNELMNEIIASDPNNPEIYFNLGAASAELKDTAKAEAYYMKAIELNPDYASALINFAVLKLGKESSIVEEMNSLGNSRADNARYDELKVDRKNMYLEALPFLERATILRPDNIEVMRTLMNIYSQTGKDAKYKILKDKIQTLEGGQ